MQTITQILSAMRKWRYGHVNVLQPSNNAVILYNSLIANIYFIFCTLHTDIYTLTNIFSVGIKVTSESMKVIAELCIWDVYMSKISNNTLNYLCQTESIHVHKCHVFIDSFCSFHITRIFVLSRLSSPTNRYSANKVYCFVQVTAVPYMWYTLGSRYPMLKVNKFNYAR